MTIPRTGPRPAPTDRGPAPGPPAEDAHAQRAGRALGAGAFRPHQLVDALPTALRKLDPRRQIRNPVMFVVWVGSAVVTVCAILDPSVFAWLVAVWLWFTVVFANLAEAVAEGRGRAQADALRRTRTDTTARRVPPGGGVPEEVAATTLRLDDRVVVEAGMTIPGDGEIVEGIATVDESAITGESAPVIRESGGDFSSVTGGTTVLSDRIVVRITATPGESFVDRMIALVEGAHRQRTPNEIALTILLAALTIVFLLAVVTLQPMAGYSGQQQSLVVLVALLVCLIPTTIGALLSAIGIAGMDRLVQRNVLATSGRAVEAAGDVSTLLLDKTGTITYGNRQATRLYPIDGVDPLDLARAARLSSLADTTPEGRSIVALCAREHDLPVEVDHDEAAALAAGAEFVPFSASTRMSGIDLDGVAIRKGATASVLDWVGSTGDAARAQVEAIAAEISDRGGTPLVVADHVSDLPVHHTEDRSQGGAKGLVELSDVVKPGIAERFADLRTMGIRTVMVTGDNPLTARAIADESGVDDVLAEATPEDKLELIRSEQAGGRLVAMTGDGTNDAPALAQADVGVAMNSGTAAAKEAGNMVDLDSDPAKLIGVVEVGKQMLVTRGALTTFSVANDLAKYFAILPAMFVGIFPQLGALNIMRLATPQSAILSAVVFNALVIVALIPLALRGVRFRPERSDALLRRNLLVYGLGGGLVPFVGIFLIDLVLRLIPGIG